MISATSVAALRLLTAPLSRRVLDAMQDGARTAQAIADATGHRVESVYPVVNKLIAAGLLTTDGVGAAGRIACARVTVGERLRAIAEEVTHESAP